jgi:NitT/TauT family transport system substrate-binding protein
LRFARAKLARRSCGGRFIGTTSLESVVVPASQGKDTGLVFVYSLFPRPNWRLLVNAKGDITSTVQLKGKTIGLFAPGNPSEPLLGVFLAGAGLTLRDVKLQVVGLGLPAAEALKNGAVDAILMVSPVSAVWQAVGFDFRELPPPPTFTSLMGPAIAIRRSVLNDPANREPTMRFLRTWAKATLFATVNPDAAIKLDYAAYPAAKPRNVSDAQALTMGKAMQNEMLPDFAQKVDGKWGAFRSDGFAKYIAFLGLTDKIPDINALWSNALIAEINNFDANAVIEQAKNFK